jgi:hypothetical protein
MPKGQEGTPVAKETPVATEKKGHKAHNPMPDGCHAWGCKAGAKKLDFCLEHYDHFKFGLIKKTGQPVSDYEKKFGHYQAFLAKQKAHKVA